MISYFRTKLKTNFLVSRNGIFLVSPHNVISYVNSTSCEIQQKMFSYWQKYQLKIIKTGFCYLPSFPILFDCKKGKPFNINSKLIPSFLARTGFFLAFGIIGLFFEVPYLLGASPGEKIKASRIFILIICVAALVVFLFNLILVRNTEAIYGLNHLHIFMDNIQNGKILFLTIQKFNISDFQFKSFSLISRNKNQASLRKIPWPASMLLFCSNLRLTCSYCRIFNDKTCRPVLSFLWFNVSSLSNQSCNTFTKGYFHLSHSTNFTIW